jgi:hypothetical protein
LAFEPAWINVFPAAKNRAKQLYLVGGRRTFCDGGGGADSRLRRLCGRAMVWPQFLSLMAIGTLLLGFSVTRFRKTIGEMV